MMDQLMAADYRFGLFSSSNMYRPVTLDRTAFANVPNLRIETKPVDAPAWERDRIMTDEWMSWLDLRRPDEPFFGFLFAIGNLSNEQMHAQHPNHGQHVP